MINNANNYQLSICIPTYKRCKYLEYLLNGIIAQLNKANLWHKVEICISDNASDDGTREMIEKYQTNYAITYFCHAQNMGADINFLKCVEIATGSYCWLFGSDDRFEDGAIEKMLDTINKYPDISGILVGVSVYDISFKNLNGTNCHLTKLFISRNMRKIYPHLGIYFGYLSAQIINRAQWNEVLATYDVSKYFNAYVHVYIIAQIIKRHAYWLYLPDRLVGWRANNDEFLQKTVEGYYARLRLDYGLYNIAESVFGKWSCTSYGYKNKMCSGIIFGGLQRMKMLDINIWPLFIEVSYKFFYVPSYYTKILPLFFFPKPMIKAIHFIKKILRVMLNRYE